MLDRKKRARAVARILAGETTPEAEAARLSTHKRTVERWVAAAKAAGQSAAPQDAVPPAEGQNPATDADPREQGGSSADLDAALGAAGEMPTGAAQPTAADKGEARADIEGFCVDAYAGLKSAVGAVLAQTVYSPTLDPSSAEVQRLLKVGAVAETAIRANAPRLYPILVKWASGWGPLAIALGVDSFGMIAGLKAAAVQKGWVPKPRRSSEAAEPASAAPRKPFEGMRGHRPQDVDVARHRKDLTGEERPSGPATSAPTSGTVNAPAVKMNGAA